MTLRNGIKKQLEKRKEQQGSYLVEAALTLPVFIISVTALILITTIISICEDVSFVTALEMRDINMQVYNQTKSISLCNRIENRVLKNCKKISDFQIKKADFLYEQNHIYDLIGITSETNFTVDNPIGILGKIKFEESLLTRGFTGALQDALPLEESAFVQDQRSVSVVVFPKYGKRYHTKNCRYVIKEYAGEGYKLEMEKEDAIRKGYSTCFVCGGGIDVL